MIDGSGPAVVTVFERAADSALPPPEGASSVGPAAAFLAGELLSRAEARAGSAGLVPSDLRAEVAPPAAWGITGFFLCRITRNCVVTVGFLKCGGAPDEERSPVTPETPKPTGPPRPHGPVDPDAPDR